MEKWQEQVEEILREHCQGDEPSEWLKMTEALIELTRKVEVPSGDVGQFIDQVFNIASEKKQPLMAAYIGFRIGVAYERYQNANRRV
ncbi:hypothetical protein ES705_37522 [subsurface metagenome]